MVLGNRLKRIVASDYGMPTLLNSFTSALRRRPLVNHVKQLITTFSFWFRQSLLHIFLRFIYSLLHNFKYYLWLKFYYYGFVGKFGLAGLACHKRKQQFIFMKSFHKYTKTLDKIAWVWQIQPSHNVYAVCFKTTNHIHSCK